MSRDIAVPLAPSVLLVGDCRDDRQMYAAYLRVQRFHVVEIDNTGDALALSATTDVIVTGVRVAGAFDGVELIRRLRADDRTKGKPILVVTASAVPADEQRARAAGCDVFLQKPCLPETLLAAIRHVLQIGALPFVRTTPETNTRRPHKPRSALQR
jgi:two-component system, cell cycle response regulator DivK